MSILIERGTIIGALCDALKAGVPELKLVKPYHGELDRYSKKVQLKQNTFPAMVNLVTPFALIISKDRRREEGHGSSLKFRHDLSVYIGVANEHDFSNEKVPDVFALLTRCVDTLHGKVFVRGAGVLNMESDGEYLITTDLFTVYDQKYTQLEIGR